MDRVTVHIHWRRPVTDIYGPYAITATGCWGWRRYRCRCGVEWVRDERKPDPPRWREVR